MPAPLAISYIRFSTLEQKKGDSYRRQYERTKEYCEDHGLNLSEEKYLDEGLSAYRGKNKEQGRLGDLLLAIKDGKIPNGSYLLIESLDRLSRDAVTDQLGLFTSILKQGIKIVTLLDGITHSEERIREHPYEIVGALMTMIRANEESATKGKRVAAAWANKRKNAGTKPLTRMAPAWLKLENDRFSPIPDRVAIVEEIFQDCLSGLGRRATSKKLNQRGVPVWGSKKRNKSGLWNDSYVVKILSNRAVLGEYQPHTKTGGKRVASGPPLEGYFPAIISEETFYACQARSEARIKRGGRAAPRAKNLFNLVARCAICGAKTEYQDKGNDDQYLRCRSSANRSMICSANGVNYQTVENFMIGVLLSGRWEKLLTAKNAGKIDALSLQAAEAKIKELDRRIDNLGEVMEAGGGDIPQLIQRLNELRSKHAQTEREIHGLRARTAEVVSKWSTYKEARLAQFQQSAPENLERRRTIKMMIEDCVEAVYLERPKAGEVGFFVVLKSGTFVVGTQGSVKGSSSRFEVVLAPWQLRTDAARLAIQYSFVADKEGTMRPRPSAFEIPPKVDIVAQCLSPAAVKTIRMLGFVPKETPDFQKQNAVQREILDEQLKDFAALTPDYTMYQGDGKILAGFYGEPDLRPLEEILAKVEKNFKSRL